MNKPLTSIVSAATAALALTGCPPTPNCPQPQEPQECRAPELLDESFFDFTYYTNLAQQSFERLGLPYNFAEGADNNADGIPDLAQFNMIGMLINNPEYEIPAVGPNGETGRMYAGDIWNHNLSQVLHDLGGEYVAGTYAGTFEMIALYMAIGTPESVEVAQNIADAIIANNPVQPFVFQRPDPNNYVSAADILGQGADPDSDGYSNRAEYGAMLFAQDTVAWLQGLSNISAQQRQDLIETATIDGSLGYVALNPCEPANSQIFGE